VIDGSYGDALRRIAEEHGGLACMRPAERELRVDLAPLVADGLIEPLDHGGWLTTTAQFEDSQSGGPPWRMDAFYRTVRRERDVLMDPDGKPVGGKFSFDAENRKPWRGEPEAPELPRFAPDEVTREVGALIEARFADHPGVLDLGALPTTRENALTFWAWAREECLPTFGPFEDAMSTKSRTLFHTRLSSLIHLHRLTPREVLDGVLELDIELASKEGFVRQLLGWREFVRHVHTATDGFRTWEADPTGARAHEPELGAPAEPAADATFALDAKRAGAQPSFLDAHGELPPAYWGERSGLACLDTVVASVLEEGYSHHITRLMVLSNLATLLDVEPRELTDWFWALYTDAYDWVVEPNVLAMGTFGTGPLMTTKPYVSGAAYIHRMSDHCKGCAFDPKGDCPITPLYWAFLARHANRLEVSPRLNLPYANLAKRSDEQREADAETFERVRETLAAGKVLGPD